MFLPSFLVVLLFAALVVASDFYKILDVHKSASDKDIRAAYKRLSKKFHPDKNKDPDAENRLSTLRDVGPIFRKLLNFLGLITWDCAAYEVLSDPAKRQIYDRHGEEGLKAHEGGQNQPNPFDVFSNFFGGQHQQQARRGPSSLTEFEVSLADIYQGASIDVSLWLYVYDKEKILCDHCRGSGAASDGDIHTCSGCNGAGVKLVKQQIFPGMFAQSQVSCNECDITPGMPEGHEVVFEGEADESPDWEPGNVVLRVRSKKEKGGWRRKETSLYWKETIGIDEALLGFQRNITLLDGRNLEVVRKGVTQPGFVQVIKGEGMPSFGRKDVNGDLFVEYNVVLPVDISPELRRKLTEAFRPASSTHDEL
ncbi:DnaJ domain-containing protein [Pholiota molesta]|nr:DnaJ domain-containing protein [Pholiota molesta]